MVTLSKMIFTIIEKKSKKLKKISKKRIKNVCILD